MKALTIGKITTGALALAIVGADLYGNCYRGGTKYGCGGGTGDEFVWRSGVVFTVCRWTATTGYVNDCNYAQNGPYYAADDPVTEECGYYKVYDNCHDGQPGFTGPTEFDSASATYCNGACNQC